MRDVRVSKSPSAPAPDGSKTGGTLIVFVCIATNQQFLKHIEFLFSPIDSAGHVYPGNSYGKDNIGRQGPVVPNQPNMTIPLITGYAYAEDDFQKLGKAVTLIVNWTEQNGSVHTFNQTFGYPVAP
ncbi:hypothetical protein [Novosphingobium sp.]|uniref:hypothetical protein n=1 Tax=Novosphingobium sp. TaxID=1874826 RepID=UPI00333E2BE5